MPVWFLATDPTDTRQDTAHDMVTAVYLIRGRLNDEPPRSYALEVTKKIEGALDNSFYFVAYLGRSNRNRPLVLTKRGVLEVLSDGYDLEDMPTYIVMDEARSVVLARRVHVDAGKITVWLDGLFLSAPEKKAGLLRIDETACKGEDALSGALVTADDANIESSRGLHQIGPM